MDDKTLTIAVDGPPEEVSLLLEQLAMIGYDVSRRPATNVGTWATVSRHNRRARARSLRTRITDVETP
jgi:hypothetical protein